MHWFAQGVTARVTNLFDAPARLAWSPDGRHLAFVMRVPEKREPLKVTLPEKPADAKWADPLKAIDRMVYRADGEGFLPDAFAQLFVVPSDGGAARQLTQGAFDHDGVAWTADGAEILVSANRHENADLAPADSEVYAVDVASGATRALTQRFGPDAEPAASPDGKYVAYTGYDDAFQGYQRARLYVMRRDNGESRELAASLDRDVQHPVWSRDSRRIYFQYDDQGTTRVAESDLSGRVTSIIDDLGGEAWSRPYGGGSFSVARDGTIAYTANDALDHAQVAVVDGGKPRRLTGLNAELFAVREFGRVEEIWSTTPADGRRVQSWLIRPPGYDPAKKYPLILEIHGGPFANYGPRFAAELQLYAAAGYNVLFSNPRGSTSYGEEFGNLIHHAYPGRDYDDLMAAVDAAIASGGVDGDRLFVTGGSGGGVLTAWIVGSTERFRAAAVQKPVINWVSFALTADMPNFFYKYWFPAPPWEDPEAYWQRSPLSRVGNVKTPTMIVTGEQDFRTPISESEQFYQALRIRGVDTLLVRVPGAPHALDQRPSQLNARIAYILAWFAKHDGPAAQAAKAATVAGVGGS
jgi:dipeptidyl aminopeptidase/acylaminoacyl peptidase